MNRRQLIGGLTATLADPSVAGAADAQLAATALIDSDADPIRDASRQLTADRSGQRERALAIFRFVRDEIRFGFNAGFYEMKASDVLAARRGFCNNQSTLFVALLRAAGIRARSVFVDLRADILSGVVDPGTPYVDHSFVEVDLPGGWVATDAYIVDPALHRAASARLREEGRLMGYGVHANGRPDWNGRDPSFVQFVDDGSQTITSRRYGVHADVEAFYKAHPEAWNRLTLPARLIFPFAAMAANRSLDRLRRRVA